MQSAVSCVLCILIAATFVCAANATYCRAPPDLRHGSHSGKGQRFFRAGSTVTYRCNRGYRLHGWRSTVCYYNRWKGAYWAKPAPLCIRKDLAYLALLLIPWEWFLSNTIGLHTVRPESSRFNATLYSSYTTICINVYVGMHKLTMKISLMQLKCIGYIAMCYNEDRNHV